MQREPVQVTTIGEAMIALFPDTPLPLAEAHTFGSDVGGAEFNVASTLARMGIRTAWISRLGADGFGDRIRRTAAEAGVDTAAVETDDKRATGLYVKETASGLNGTRTRMHYYRRESAASAIGPALLRSEAAAAALRESRIVHTSGITAALSVSAAEALAGLRDAVGPHAIVSVDLNYRPLLWRDRATDPLDALVAQADALFVGVDEAGAHFGHADGERLFADHPRLSRLVLKDEAMHASTLRRDGTQIRVPCLTVEVVEPVGAGDAFAAGYLAALVEGRDETTCLRLGHALAALTLIGSGDRPVTVPDAAERDRIAAAPDEVWAAWRVHPGEIPWRRS